MGILRTDRITGLGGANAISGSAHFQGSHDGTAWLRYIDAGASDDFNFGTGDFTVECWINRTTLSVTLLTLYFDTPSTHIFTVPDALVNAT